MEEVVINVYQVAILVLISQIVKSVLKLILCKEATVYYVKGKFLVAVFVMILQHAINAYLATIFQELMLAFYVLLALKDVLDVDQLHNVFFVALIII